MDDAPLELWLDGRRYRRYPHSRDKAKQRYYTCTSGKGFRVYHRDLWEKLHGPIPPGWHVHHADKNPLNNDPGNYECLSPAEHAARHAEEYAAHPGPTAAALAAAAEWHRSAEGSAWHREHGKRTWDDREAVDAGPCPECGEPMRTYFDGAHGRVFCSVKCHRRKADREHRYEVGVPCPVCGEPFWQNKYRRKPATCSRRCAGALRRR